MKKFVILLLAALILLSGCVGQKAAVKIGDNISVNYIGRLPDGKVFDTNIETVAKENNLFNAQRTYTPFQFVVGHKQVIKGFDEGVIGMKVGDSITLTIPPEKAYPLKPDLIRVVPIVQDFPANDTLPKMFNISIGEFNQYFGTNHTIGNTVKIPDTNINITIKNITSEVSLAYDLKVGDNVWEARAPWNETVIKIDDKNITLRPNVTTNMIIKIPSAFWNTTVIGINSTRITLRHNPIPPTSVAVPDMYGQEIPMKISFNETSIIMDQNREFAGKTLVFNVTLVSINK
ncbi:MAG: FKBP-type peptidyl-prolyl cis-trans isomerase [Candidatus Methanoperedens sp.]|nr:FKBP-type peptidyl-prolyl cis-trans isomerase [Candidatus Methanoperedens sp.]MCZ7403403.1 FKBP-type peptidyl-prolyl cis-trans isomerase [Candidatus Methanoperedens sp.]